MRLRWIGILMLPIVLSGCALPAAISIASLVLDAGSYMVSGKTMSDHGLSLALNQDCALARILEGEICKEEPDYDVALTALAPLLPEGSDLDLALASGEDNGLIRGDYIRWALPSDNWGDAYGKLVAKWPSESPTFYVEYLSADVMEPDL